MTDHVMTIAICGGLRSGKDTVGQLLVNKHQFTRFAFGDGIRDLCREFFPERMAAGKDRQLLQGIGQDMRKYDPDVWVKRTLTEIEEMRDEPFRSHAHGDDRFVITDLRQPNEYAALRAAGYAIVRVNASLESRQRRAEAAGDIFRLEDLQHDTESHFERFAVDYELQNDGGIDQLTQQVDAMLAYLQAGGAASGIR